MKQIELTQDQVTLVDDEDYQRIEEIDAARAYEKASLEVYGEYSRVTPIHEGTE